VTWAAAIGCVLSFLRVKVSGLQEVAGSITVLIIGFMEAV
jgi:hypothetical protein